MTDPVDKDKFVPAFAMPVIAPPPDGYVGGTAAYYAAVLLQSAITFADVKVGPEDKLALQQGTPAPEPKGLKIGIPNPSGLITGFPPFGTLFAVMGGWLSYVRAVPDTVAGSTVNLAPILLPPFDGVIPAPQYSAPAGLDPPAAPWGAFVLRLWGPDFDKLAGALGQSPACAAVYYLGVDEASAKTALEPSVKLHFRQDHYDQSVANGTKPVFQDVVEQIKGQAYATTPTLYGTLVADFLIGLLNGNTSLLVKGGSPIGETVRVIDSTTTTPQAVGHIELWFMDGSTSQLFIAPTQMLRGAPTYDFLTSSAFAGKTIRCSTMHWAGRRRSSSTSSS